VIWRLRIWCRCRFNTLREARREMRRLWSLGVARGHMKSTRFE
jgi:hypothetical protein